MKSNKLEVMQNIVPINETPKWIKIAEKTLRNWRAGGLYPQLFVRLGGKVFIVACPFGTPTNLVSNRSFP